MSQQGGSWSAAAPASRRWTTDAALRSRVQSDAAVAERGVSSIRVKRNVCTVRGGGRPTVTHFPALQTQRGAVLDTHSDLQTPICCWGNLHPLPAVEDSAPASRTQSRGGAQPGCCHRRPTHQSECKRGRATEQQCQHAVLHAARQSGQKAVQDRGGGVWVWRARVWSGCVGI